MSSLVKTAEEIESMRRSGQILAEILDYLKGEVKVGMTTAEIADITAEQLKQKDAEAAFLGYNGFPAVICVSVNSQLVHGIPGDYVIKEGDIVGLDLGVKYQNMITDGAITIPVGKISGEAKKLLTGTQRALDAALTQIKAGAKVGDIAHAIEATLKLTGLSVAEDLSGHGVGRAVHEEPEIPNKGRTGSGPELLAGMTIAVEPMASLGGGRIKVQPDGWTIAMADGSLAAQFEHTILVTDSGAEVLTQLSRQV